MGVEVKGVGTEMKIRREAAVREGVGTPKGAPQRAWFSSKFLERIRKTPQHKLTPYTRPTEPSRIALLHTSPTTQ